MGAISADNVDLSYFLLLETVEDFVSIKASPRGSKNRATFFVNVFDKFRCKFYPIILNVSVKALITPFDSEDIFDFVVVVKSHEKFSDHNVKTGA